MKLDVTPSIILIIACAIATPLVVLFLYSFVPSSWIETTVGMGFVLLVLNFVCVGVFTLLCFHLAPIFGLNQVLLFSIAALIVTRAKQMLLSTPKELGIMEATTLLFACLLVFCVTLFLLRKKNSSNFLKESNDAK